MRTINKQKIEDYKENGKDILLINVLPEKYFQKQHIPGSINIPFKENDNFVEQVEEKASTKHQRVVLYCKNKECQLSEDAAQKLEDAGFTQVEDYEAGVDNWFEQESSVAA